MTVQKIEAREDLKLNGDGSDALIAKENAEIREQIKNIKTDVAAFEAMHEKHKKKAESKGEVTNFAPFMEATHNVGEYDRRGQGKASN